MNSVFIVLNNKLTPHSSTHEVAWKIMADFIFELIKSTTISTNNWPPCLQCLEYLDSISTEE